MPCAAFVKSTSKEIDAFQIEMLCLMGETFKLSEECRYREFP